MPLTPAWHRFVTGWLQSPGSPADPGSVTPAIAHGPEGILQVGHREYVGGRWEEIGTLQFDFLVGQGLRPHHHLLDIGCGCLRGGRHFIPYLDPGHYLGIDKEADLLTAGLHELGAELIEERQPRLRVSEDFDFAAFGVAVDFALAQSLFTHLPATHIERCLSRLRPCLQPQGIFFATFFECAGPRRNPRTPHDHGYFAYTRRQMEVFGRRGGWEAVYIGAWNHPRGQHMMLYRPR